MVPIMEQAAIWTLMTKIYDLTVSLDHNKGTHWPLGKFEWYFRYVVFKWILVIDGLGISCEIAQIWMSLEFTDD